MHKHARNFQLYSNVDGKYVREFEERPQTATTAAVESEEKDG